MKLATQVLALSEEDRKRFIPMMNAFNLKDANAGQYILEMVRAFPGVWAGFGELHFKKQEVSQKVAGGTINLFSRDAIQSWMKVIQEDLGAYAMLHCDIDVPGTAGLMKETYAPFLYPDGPPAPKFRDAFIENVLRPNNKAPLIWAHFAGLGRADDSGVGPRDDHWEVIDNLLGDPDFSHVYVDLSWGPVFTGALLGNPENRQKTIDLVKKYPDRFIYGSDQEGSSWELTLGPAFDTWAPLWDALTPEETRMIRVDNFAAIADQSAANIRAWEKSQGL